MTVNTSIVRVDTHFHVFEAGKAVPDARYVPAYNASLVHWRQLASRAGVSHGVLVQPSFLGDDNSLLLATLAHCPDGLRGVAVIDPHISPDQLAQMNHAGVRGIRLNLFGRSQEMIRWEYATALWDRLLEMKWHVELHTDPGGLPDVLQRLPGDLRIVVDHMARPANATARDPTMHALRVRQKEGVFVKLSGAYRLGVIDPHELARVLLGEIGPSALLWGSDWPCTNFEKHADYAALLSSLEDWVGPELLRDVLCVNPMRLFWESDGAYQG
jgi:predicted TIM-barrel fold metal-dependent hydrolase